MVARENFAGVLALVQRRGGGALLFGARGLLTRSSELGVWTRVPVPAAMAGESLLSGSETATGRLALLGSRHLAILDSLGRGLRVEPLRGPARPEAVLLTDSAIVALVYRDSIHVERADGTPVGSLWQLGGRSISSWLALSDGRLVFGLAGDLADPFARGALLIVAVDSSGMRDRRMYSPRLRSNVTALLETDGRLVVYTPSGSHSQALGALPLAKKEPATAK